MGETKLNVTVRVGEETLVRIDNLVQQYSPFCEGRSSLARILLEIAIAGIDSGILPDTLEGIQALLCQHCKPKLIVKGGTR